MLAMAAARLGLKTHIYCEESGPAFDVATLHDQGRLRRSGARSLRFAGKVDAVTYEFENVPIDTRLQHLAAPGARAARRQGAGGGAGPARREAIHRRARHPRRPFPRHRRARAARRRAVASRGAGDPEDAPARLRRQRPGERGARATMPPRPGQRIGAQPAVLEQRIAFALELSALVVRSAAGELAFYDCPRNTHESGILRRSVVPSGLPGGGPRPRPRHRRDASPRALGYVGVLAVEMFHLGPEAPAAERLMVNEIAPRVHNSGHWTIEACAISQFENHMRAVAGWPLGSTERHSDAEMVNLIGKEALDWPRARRRARRLPAPLRQARGPRRAARWDTSPASGPSSCEGRPGSRGGVQLTLKLGLPTARPWRPRTDWQ